MSAIERCRTAALGGHVERCEDCTYTTIAYNSCLMGKASNGELAEGRIFLCISALALSITRRLCVPFGAATDGRSQTGTNMLETYFSASKMLGHLRSGPSGRVEDGRGSLGPMANAPFPIPAHRTGRADFRHPALRLVSP
jgi:hypothetical protein